MRRTLGKPPHNMRYSTEHFGNKHLQYHFFHNNLFTKIQSLGTVALFILTEDKKYNGITRFLKYITSSVKINKYYSNGHATEARAFFTLMVTWSFIMSVIALKWAYSQKIGNHIAKSILAFLASHNFGSDQTCFRIKTIAAALDLKETAVKEGLTFLAEKGLIKKEARYGEKGERLANVCTLMIPKDYIEESYKDYEENYKSDLSVDNSGGVGRNTTGGGSQYDGGVGRNTTPLNNKLLNNNYNKSFYNKAVKKQNNTKRHAFADSKDQMANEQKHIQEHEARKKDEINRPRDYPEALSKIRKSLKSKIHLNC